MRQKEATAERRFPRTTQMRWYSLKTQRSMRGELHTICIIMPVRESHTYYSGKVGPPHTIFVTHTRYDVRLIYCYGEFDSRKVIFISNLAVYAYVQLCRLGECSDFIFIKGCPKYTTYFLRPAQNMRPIFTRNMRHIT